VFNIIATIGEVVFGIHWLLFKDYFSFNANIEKMKTICVTARRCFSKEKIVLLKVGSLIVKVYSPA